MRPWSHVKLPTPVTIQAITVPRLRCIGWLVLFLEGNGSGNPAERLYCPLGVGLVNATPSDRV
jgi:hypothetical protein